MYYFCYFKEKSGIMNYKEYVDFTHRLKLAHEKIMI